MQLGPNLLVSANMPFGWHEHDSSFQTDGTLNFSSGEFSPLASVTVTNLEEDAQYAIVYNLSFTVAGTVKSTFDTAEDEVGDGELIVSVFTAHGTSANIGLDCVYGAGVLGPIALRKVL